MSLTRLFLALFLCLTFLNCNKDDSEDSIQKIFITPTPTPVPEPTPEPKYIYVSSGTCYAGGVATSTGSATIARFRYEDGAFDSIVMDYNTFAPGDFPVGLLNFDNENLLVAIENASGRRVDKVAKDGSQFNVFLLNSTALSGILRDIKRSADGSILISKSTAIEKFTTSKARVTQGANPFISAPGSVCATTATLISSFALMPNDKIAFVHAAASPNNKLNLISSSGYVTTADCLGTLAAPVTTAMPTSVIYHSSGYLVVAYGSITPASNLIGAYTLDYENNIIGSFIESFKDLSVINGPTVMYEDPVTKEIYIANGAAAYNNIEKFTIDSMTGLMQRVGQSSFIPQNIFTRCVTGILISN